MIILQQLGGNKFIAMTGAKDFVRSGDTMLQFSVGRGATNKTNKVRIELDANDTYTMRFYRIWKMEAKVIEEITGLYAEDLQRIFTDRTGFLTSL